MALNLAELAHMHDFDLETGALGRIRCGSISVKIQAEIEKLQSAKDVDGLEFVRKVLGLVGSRIEGDQIEIEGDDGDMFLSNSDVEQLTDTELEDFANKFFAHNNWILHNYKDGERTVRKNEKGEQIVSVKPATIDMPKNDGERDSDYLLRVFRRHTDERAIRLKRLMNPITSAFSKSIFSNSTQNLMKNHLALSDRLRESVSSFNRLSEPGIKGVLRQDPLQFRMPEPPDNPTHKTNEHLNEFLNHVEAYGPIISQSAGLIQSMSETVLQMHADFNRSARQSAAFSLLVIVIAAASLVLTSIFSWWSYEHSKEQELSNQRMLEARQAQLDKLVQHQSGQIKQLVNTLLTENHSRSDKDQKQLIEALSEAIRSVRNDSPTVSGDMRNCPPGDTKNCPPASPGGKR